MARKVRYMARKVSSTSMHKGAPNKGTTKPTAAKKEPTATKSEKGDEGWGPIGAAAKKVGKGAIKGAAKEILK